VAVVVTVVAAAKKPRKNSEEIFAKYCESS
jgi:hypothetical protein